MKTGTIHFILICVYILPTVITEDWWENANFYQIYPRSFQDSDGDGIGDLKGISQRLEYFKYLGITGIWLSPVFSSPMEDFGYDISDYCEIHYEYGTMADFDELLQRCKELDIKLVLDFVPNHSSDQHKWFKASSDPNHPEHKKYKDYYVWHDGKKAQNGTVLGPPSNWLSIFRYSAWTYHEKRKQYYLHQFLPSQPDVNFRNPDVCSEMEEILRFWFDKGVDGFRIDAIPFLYETKENLTINKYDDEPKSGYCNPNEHCYLNHPFTADLDETFEMVYQWRKVTDSYTDSTRVLMTEAYSSVETNMRYYGGMVKDNFTDGAHIPFNFELMNHARRDSNAYEYQEYLWRWLNNMPKRPGVHANWLLGNHDQKRFASRLGSSRVDLLNILIKTLPGISITYYGEEIGMTDVYISWENTVDPQACRANPDTFHYASRDPARTPFQWNSTHNAGFSTAQKTWLPLPENYTACNVELQERHKRSHLKVFKALLELRKHKVMRYGYLSTTVFADNILVYTRGLHNATEIYYFILNFGSKNVSVPLKNVLDNVPTKVKVIITSIQSKSLLVGTTIDSDSIEIDAEVGAVFVGEHVVYESSGQQSLAYSKAMVIISIFSMSIAYLLS